MKKSFSVRSIVLGGLFIALGYVMPYLTMQIPNVGSMLLPMHLPVLLAGFVCGGPIGLIVGAVTPLLRSVIAGMPPMYPTAIAMAFELAAYGFLTVLFYRLFPKKSGYIYLELLLAMLGGRIVWGLVSMLLYGVKGNAFTFAIFLNGAFINALPGIILQIVLIPIIVFALERAGLIRKDR